MSLAIRRAVAREAQALRKLARASKAYWGYSKSYLEKWNYDERITAGYIESEAVFCAHAGAWIAGFYALEFEAARARIVHFWVAPDFIGRGVGTALLEHAAQQARSRRAGALVVSSEPHAVAFYERFGARRIGEVRAPLLRQTFPVLELDVERVAPAPSSAAPGMT